MHWKMRKGLMRRMEKDFQMVKDSLRLISRRFLMLTHLDSKTLKVITIHLDSKMLRLISRRFLTLTHLDSKPLKVITIHLDSKMLRLISRRFLMLTHLDSKTLKVIVKLKDSMKHWDSMKGIHLGKQTKIHRL